MVTICNNYVFNWLSLLLVWLRRHWDSTLKNAGSNTWRCEAVRFCLFVCSRRRICSVNVFVLNSEMYLSQTLKCICLGWCESVGGVCLFVCPPGVGIAESSVSLFSVRQGSPGPAIVSWNLNFYFPLCLWKGNCGSSLSQPPLMSSSSRIWKLATVSEAFLDDDDYDDDDVDDGDDDVDDNAVLTHLSLWARLFF